MTSFTEGPTASDAKSSDDHGFVEILTLLKFHAKVVNAASGLDAQGGQAGARFLEGARDGVVVGL